MTDLVTHPRLITLEGGEGAGKSTVLAALRMFLIECEDDVVCTREPGGTLLAELIRNLLLGRDHEAPSAQTELLLMFAARAQHVRETILPALERSAWVISDRFTDASHAYQGGGRGLDADFISALERHAVGIQPGLTLLLDVPVTVGRERASGRGHVDRIESEQDSFFQRVRDTYLARAEAEPRRFRVIDATQTPQAVAAEAVAHLQAWRMSL
ncbi:MAG: dTMP kinase [Luteimonas sp.]